MKLTQESPFHERILGLLAFVYGGLHHVDVERIRWTDLHGERPHATLSVYARLATYDYCELTSLVVGAHDLAIRVEILASGPNHVKLMMHPRQREHESCWGRHPELEAHAKFIRERMGRWYDDGVGRDERGRTVAVEAPDA